MSTKIYIKTSGKTRECIYCGNIINQGQPAVYVSGYRINVSRCIDCIIKEIQKLMPKAITTFPSASHPGKFYTIYEAADGTHYCDCWQWKQNKTCKHLKAFQQGNPGVKTEEPVNVISGNPELENVINNIINRYCPAK